MSEDTLLGDLLRILAWVAPGPERQLVAAAKAPEGAKGALAVDEGVQAVSAPLQAPQPPSAASPTRNIP
uniref:Uncharacterized protein n=1 Tax=Tanacetum cinerariifolium TaxID=118510 RepID=A0A6L2NLR5_TANCI|nr:hypothetical protein [Tanacetum cinerariifolium]